MKILYIITKSEIGGAQTHVFQLMKAMKEKGHDIALTSFPGGWLEQKAKEIGVVFYPNLYFSNSYNPSRALKAIRGIQEVVKVFKPSLVSCHSTAGGFFGRMAIRGKVPTIFTAHSWAFTEGAPLIRKILAPVLEKMTAPYTAKIICVSEYDRKLALKYRIAKKQKLITIHNGIAIPETIQRAVHENMTILFLGRLAYPKELELLVDSYCEIPEQIRKQTNMKIVGVGPDKGRIASRIEMLGLGQYISLSEVSPEEVQQTLKSADLFILLSKHEGFPMTILEAMASGLPVIASAVGGIPEQIDASCGILVQNKKEEIIHALTTLITDRGEREKKGLAAREKAYTKFNLEKFLSETENIYRDVLTTSKRS